MNVIISARHCNPSASLRRNAEKRVRRLTRYEPRIVSATVTFDTDHGANQVEARLSVAGGHTVVAHATTYSFEESLSRVMQRLHRQLKRRRERHRNIRR